MRAVRAGARRQAGRFRESGGGATAKAAAGGKGGTADDTQIKTGMFQRYPMTTTGFAVGLSAAGRKYWKDAKLNAAK